MVADVGGGAELEEGPRLVTNLVDVDATDVHIGMAVEVGYETFDGDVVLHQFHPEEAS
ncbi:MAG: OB-fold domain-containing protein [Acidimicrobiales bacterium]|nr:OB-fold domain-containing protein [Acidimicrobiales bacterium]